MSNKWATQHHAGLFMAFISYRWLCHPGATVHILLIRKLRHKTIKLFVQGHKGKGSVWIGLLGWMQGSGKIQIWVAWCQRL